MPVIYHDFVVSIATKSKTDVLAEDVEMIEVPLKDFTFKQLHKLKVYYLKKLFIYLYFNNNFTDLSC